MILMYSFELHSNESACRKSGRLGLEQVNNVCISTIKYVFTKLDFCVCFFTQRPCIDVPIPDSDQKITISVQQ